MKFSPAFAAVAAGLFPLALTGPLKSQDNGTMVYDFSKIKPSPELNWTPCYENYTCSLLEVPLDYEDPSVGTTNVAWIKWSSQNASAEDVLVNPGGPGGSGVEFIFRAFANLETKLGSQFNFVGFDPRGVNNSGPSMSCFPGSPVGRKILDAEAFTPVDDSTEYTLRKSYERSGMWGEWCSGVHAVNGTAKYANTVAVANDMRHYIELRAKSIGQPPEEAKLWFYGISYGTVLGATYAALFPDRIARMMLDGVVDTEDYYNTGWKSFLWDTDAAAKTFYANCFEAGAENCKFHGNSTSPKEIEERYLAIYDTLKKSPQAVADPALGIQPVVVTAEDLSSAFFTSAYDAVKNWPVLAEVFTELEKGNYSMLAMATQRASLVVPTAYDLQDTRTLTSCIDANGRFNVSNFDDYKEHIDFMIKQSFYGGPLFGAIVGSPCYALDIYPPESQIFHGVQPGTKTSTPILWIGSTLDAATAIRGARKMSSLFTGSEVLEVNVTRHGTMSITSPCEDEYTRAYFASTSLPPPGTVCEVEDIPFITYTLPEGPARLAKRDAL
ncbi:hypothetical protein K469DRAFT_695696 [Zopfia rhizophila CBS 207.26]|uniref:Alpha/beta-hydrolase n=1 Tax=Zopfia rhizophila CBS 207.26 TaxID=1314779 RepID=A0A6A6DFD7_9PEZI|nr:hypothetical protein K469DRAFT_695696 [Zopfia rhizophila CBS 207.26]